MKEKIKKRLEESKKTKALMEQRIAEYEALLAKLEVEPELETLGFVLLNERGEDKKVSKPEN